MALLGLAKPPPVAWLLNCMAAMRPAHGPSMLIYVDLYTMGIHGIFMDIWEDESRNVPNHIQDPRKFAAALKQSWLTDVSDSKGQS